MIPSQQEIPLGRAATIPVPVRIRDLQKPQRPRSDDPSFWHTWLGCKGAPPNWTQVVKTWEKPDEEVHQAQTTESIAGDDIDPEPNEA